MSTLQVTTVTSPDANTPLILKAANTSGGQIVLNAANSDIQFIGPLRFTANITGDGSGLTFPSSNVANAAFGKANTSFQNTTGVLAGSLYIPSGGIGVGVTSTGYAIEAVGSVKISPNINNGILLYENGGSIQGFLGPSGFGGLAIGTQSSNNLIFFSNNSERMRIDASGNVGIGTSAPSSPIHISKTTSSGDYRTSLIIDNSDQRTIVSSYYEPGVAQRTILRSIQPSTSGAIPISFEVGSTEAMRINGNGTVGVGVASPSYGFHHRVFGNAELATQYGTGIATYLGAYASEGGVRVTGNNPMTLWTNGVERMKIDGSGRVTMPYQPGFSAYHSTNIAYSSITNPIPFDGVRRNTGNHYNPSTYVFTAPVSGRYFFSGYVHFMDESTYTYQFLSFSTNGTGGTIEWMRQSDRQNYGVFGGSTILSLSAGDGVSLTYYSSGVDSGYFRGGSQFNVFEGQLIG